MSGCKTPRAELVAIYRLEFYRKQKHWRLSQEARKETTKKAAKTKRLLNQTFDIKIPHTEEDTDHNTAFCETGSDPDEHNVAINLTERSHYQQRWPILSRTSLQLLQSRVSLTEAETSLEQQKDLPEHIQPLHTKDQEMQSEWLNTEVIWPESMQNWPVQWPNDEPVWTDPGPTDEELMGLNKAAGSGDHGFQRRWPKESQIWINTEQVMPEVAWCKGMQEAEAADEWLHAQAWPTPRDWCPRQSVAWGGADERSVDSAGEFSRGAHAAPHSSEADLSLPESEPEPELCAREAAHLSGRQLGARVERHARALHVLMHELRARHAPSPPPQHHQPPAPPYQCSYPGTPRHDAGSGDELPTRDVGLHRPPRGPHHSPHQLSRFNDVILAGSFKNVREVDLGVPPPHWGGLGAPPGLGRGRGRLPSAGQAPGLGRGRLHRL